VPNPSPIAPPRRLGPSPWLWMVLACLGLLASGAIRISQERRFENAARSVETPPFPMRDLPTELGPWRMLGEEEYLGEETLQVAGCSDYMMRTYIDDRTGVALKVLVAFGPAELVFGHSPTVCFPAFGFEKAAGPKRRLIHRGTTGDEARDVPVDALVYSKADGGADALVEVLYTFRHADQWAPDAAETRKQFKHRPAMFKVQVERPISPAETGADHSPSEDFLAELIPMIESRLAAESSAAAG